MTKGKLIWIMDETGNCLVSPEFTCDMGTDQVCGELAIAKLSHCLTFEQFDDVVCNFARKFGYDFTDLEIENVEHLRAKNLIEKSFSNVGEDDYYEHWFSDYLYVVNCTNSQIVTKDFNGDELVLESGTLTVLRFGRAISKFKITKEIPVGGNSNGDTSASSKQAGEETGNMTYETAAKILKEFNRYRRGEGEYMWNEDPAKNKPLTLSPRVIGEAIDFAVSVLNDFVNGVKS